MTEQVDRFTLTTGPDGRGLLTLALRRHPKANADGYAKAQRYWACSPAGAQPRWLALAGSPGAPQRAADHAEDPRTVAEAHAFAAAYLPGVACSWCGDKWWKPTNRGVVTRYVLTGLTGGCLACHDESAPAPEPVVIAAAAPKPAPRAAPKPATVWEPDIVDLGPEVTVDARVLSGLTVHLDGPAAELLWSAAGGDMRTMSSMVSDLVARNYGIRRLDTLL